MKHFLLRRWEEDYSSPRWVTYLHEPVEENCPHLGLQVRMVLHHADIPGVSLILLQHVVPYHILTGPAVNNTFDSTAKLLLSFCPITDYDLYKRRTFFLSTRQTRNVALTLTNLRWLTSQELHSPQGGKWGATNGRCEYVVKVIVGEACIY